MNVLVPLPFVLPLLGAALTMISRRRETWLRVLAPLTVTAALAAAGGLMAAVARDGVIAVQIGGWTAPLGITLVADRLSALLLVVSIGVLLAIMLHAVAEGAGGLGGHEPGVFYPAYLTLTAGVALIFLAGDLFNLFVAFEIMLASSYVLMTLTPTAERVQAGMTYTVVSLMSSILFIAAIGLTYAATGSVNFADLSLRVAELPEGTRTALGLLFLVVFGIKGAIAPMHLWLPDSYPAALTAEAGDMPLIRVETLLFPRDQLSWIMLVLAAATMLIGTLGALTHDDIHRIFSFILVGHIGYMLFGLGLFSVAGLTGAVLYLVHHIVVQGALFLVSDLMQGRTGPANLPRPGAHPADGGAHGGDVAAPPRRPGTDVVVHRRAVLHPRHERERGAADLRLHRQARAVPGGARGGQVPRLRGHRGGGAGEPAHPHGDDADLDARVLAAPPEGGR